MSASVQLDLNVNTSRELEFHQGIHGLVVRIDDIKHALMRAGLILVSRVFIDVWRHQDGVTLNLSRQRDGAAHLRASPLGRLDDFAR